jgi:pimeloyl-ACP methyl ester carboxylesterase
VTAEGLSAIKAPTLVVEGGSDMAGPSELVAKTVPNATRFTVEGADHFEIPSSAQCMEAVETFINAAS